MVLLMILCAYQSLLELHYRWQHWEASGSAGPCLSYQARIRIQSCSHDNPISHLLSQPIFPAEDLTS